MSTRKSLSRIAGPLDPASALDYATRQYVSSAALPGGWVDVKVAGAKGDGTTDDTSAINTAISGSAVGSTIWFPPGTYNVTATIVLYPNRTYIGAGGLMQRATIAATSAVTGAILAAQGWTTNATVCDGPIRVQGLCIQGPGQTTGTAHGLVVLNFWSRVEDMQFLTIAGDALRLSDTTINGTNVITNSASENTVHKCRFDTIGGNGVFQASTSGNAFLDGQLEDCYFASIKADGIQMNNSAGWFIQRNHLYGIGGRAILCDQGYATHVQDNYIEDFGGNNVGGSYYCGIRLYQQGGGWPSIVSGNFVACSQAGGTATPAASVTWQNYDLVGKGAGAEINFINNMAWRSGSAGATSFTDAFTFEVQTSTVTINAVGNTIGVSSGYAFRNIWNVLTGASFAKATVPALVIPAFASTYTTDCSAGDVFRVTLTGNLTLANPTNMVDGQLVRWELIQDATGGRTVTLGAAFNDLASRFKFNLVANARSYLNAVYNAAAGQWDVVGFRPGSSAAVRIFNRINF